MPDIPATVLQQLKRFGQTCQLTYKAVGAGTSAIPAQTVSSVVRIGSRTTTVVAGQLTAAVNATMPSLARSPQGATLTAGNRTYVVQSSTEMLYGGQVYMTKLVLV